MIFQVVKISYTAGSLHSVQLERQGAQPITAAYEGKVPGTQNFGRP